MARHFLYKHLPASGLGVREPLRPYATGGIGGARYLQYLVTLADMLLYQAALAASPLVSLLLADEAARVAATVESVTAVLCEAEAALAVSDYASTASIDDSGDGLVINDEDDDATIADREAAATMVDRATVVTLTDRKVR